MYLHNKMIQMWTRQELSFLKKKTFREFMLPGKWKSERKY